MSYPSTAFHQLDLLFIDTDDCAVWISRTVQSDYKAVGEWRYLEIVPDSGHWTSLRNDVLEMIHQVKQFLWTESVGIFGLNSGNFVGYAPMHVCRRFLIDVAERIFHRVFVYPNACGQFVSIEILQRSFIGFVVAIRLFFHDYFCWIGLVVKKVV